MFQSFYLVPFLLGGNIRQESATINIFTVLGFLRAIKLNFDTMGSNLPVEWMRNLFKLTKKAYFTSEVL